MADPVLLVKGEGVGAGADSMRLQRFPVVGVGAPGEAMTPGMIPGVQLPAGSYGMPSSAEIPESAKHAPVLRQSQVTANLGMEPGAESRFQKYLTGLSGVDNQAQLQLRLYEFFRDNAYPVALRSILLERVRALYDHQGKLRVTARVRSLRQRGATPDEVPMAGDDAMRKAEQEADDELFKHMGEDTAWEALIKHVNGPFIGPRGGKWADAKHTIAWSDDLATRPPEKGSRVTVHSKGKAPPQGVKWGKNHPGAGYAATIKYKGGDYHVAFGHDGKKFTGTLTLPTGHKHAITSPNHAANVVMLHARGLDTSMTATDVKKLKLGYSAAKLFKFGEKPGERAAKKGPAKPRPVVSAKERVKHEATAARILDGAVPLPTVQVDTPAAPAAAPPPPPAAPVHAPERNKLGIVGKRAPLYMAATKGTIHEKQAAKYVLVEAEDLVPSHVPLKGFAKHPAYPENVQTRPYESDQGDQLKVHGAAGALNPEILFTPSVDAMQGPPVVTDDGIVLGGNGRTMALQLHYTSNDAKAAETRAFLAENAGTYGFTAADVQSMKNPVVVRQVETPDKSQRALATLVHRYNESSSQGLNALAESVADARRLDDPTMSRLGEHMPEDGTLKEFLGTSASRPFVSALRNTGIINQRNTNKYINDDGMLNTDGRDMVAGILTAAVLPDSGMLEDIGGQTRNSLARAAPYIMAASAAADKEWDLRPAIMAAAKDLITIRAKHRAEVEAGTVQATAKLDADGAPVRVNGQTVMVTKEPTVDEFLHGGSQTSLVPESHAVDGVPNGEAMLRLLFEHGDKPTVLANVMSKYLESARKNPRGQGGMFADDSVAPNTFKKLVADVVAMSKSLAVTSENITEWLTLAESAMRKSMEPTLTINLKKSVVTADGIAALQDLLGRLQGMREVYQDLHWNSAGPAFYADHQLFERLYTAVVEEVDALAEKIVGLTGAQLSPVLTAARLGGHVSSMVGASAAGPDNRALGMLELERAFCEKVIPEVLGTLRMTAELSEGLQNFLQGLADTHEGHVYLLDRRLADPALVKGWDVNPRASGSAIAEDVARKELLDRAGDGIGPDGLEGMTARHHPDVVKKLVKDLTERGILVKRDGQLHVGLVGPKGMSKGGPGSGVRGHVTDRPDLSRVGQKHMEATAKVLAGASAKKMPANMDARSAAAKKLRDELGSGLAAAPHAVFGRTQSGKPVHVGVDHSGFTSQDHSDAQKLAQHAVFAYPGGDLGDKLREEVTTHKNAAKEKHGKEVSASVLGGFHAAHGPDSPEATAYAAQQAHHAKMFGEPVDQAVQAHNEADPQDKPYWANAAHERGKAAGMTKEHIESRLQKGVHGLVVPAGMQKGPHTPPKAVFKPKPVESSTPPQMAPADPSQAPAVARNIARNNREAGMTLPERPARPRQELPIAPHQEK